MTMLRTSERLRWKRCPQAWTWAYNDRLVPKGPPNRNLWFGVGIHRALERWYLPGFDRGVPPWDTWADYHRNQMVVIRDHAGCDQAWDSAPFVDAGALGEAMLRGYVQHYGEDPSWKFLSTEYVGSVDLNGVTYVFTWDGVYWDAEADACYLLEHKTASTITVGHLELDEQAGTYLALANRVLAGVLGGRRIEGVTYNFLRKATPDDRPVNTAGESLNRDGTVSKRQPAPNFHRELVERRSSEHRTMLRRIMDEASVMDLQRRGQLPIWKTPVGTGAGACEHGCEFYELCLLHEAGADWETYRDRMFIRGDPYGGYTKSAYANP